ncbi:hypothetical protein ACWCW7_03330 [Nocardia tengchongensis]
MHTALTLVKGPPILPPSRDRKYCNGSFGSQRSRRTRPDVGTQRAGRLPQLSAKVPTLLSTQRQWLFPVHASPHVNPLTEGVDTVLGHLRAHELCRYLRSRRQLDRHRILQHRRASEQAPPQRDRRTRVHRNLRARRLEAAVSALSSAVGQATIPIPILGAVIGNTVGIVMYKAVASSLTKREAALIERYLDEQRALDEQLATEYQGILEKLDQSMSDYLGLLERAFSPDVQVALVGSVELAVALGVASDEILDAEEKIDAYFLD